MGNGPNAPIPDLPAFAPERGGSTQSGRSVTVHAMHDLPLRKVPDGAILTHKHRGSGKAEKKRGRSGRP
jgi:hypothetical protein